MDARKRERIERLIDRYLKIVESDRNRENCRKWEDASGWNRDMWRGYPIRGRGGMPYTIAPDNSLWGKLLGVSLIEYYSDPLIYLETQLRMKIYHYENFRDNTVFTKELYIWFGVVTELSLFGCEVVFHHHKEPWVAGRVLDSYESLQLLPLPDFFKSGLMPRIHAFYETISEVAGGRLDVMFPEFVRGPFCIAAHLRGYQQILMDMLDEPDRILDTMRFIVDAHKAWSAQRAKLTGEQQRGVKLYNDEIDGAMFGPAMYAELIFPFEQELSEHFGGINYWHSCGNTTRLLPEIAKLPKLRMTPSDWCVIMSASVIASVPIYLIFIFAQKYLVAGLAAGAIKE